MLHQISLMGRTFREPAADGADGGSAQPSEADKLRAELATARQESESLAEAVLAQVPERFKALIPDGLDAAAKVKWFQKAKAGGAFDAPVVPATDAGRKPAITPKEVDVYGLPAMARMAHGYRK